MTTADNIIEVLAVSKCFRSRAENLLVLNDVSFNVARGQTVSIIGESGCGKTTLLSIIAGLDRPDKGDVIWNNVNIKHISDDRLAVRRTTFIGFIFQDFYLINELSVFDNVLLPAMLAKSGLAKAKKRPGELLEIMRLASKSKTLPNLLSGGDRQRIAIARAMINNPSLIVADEPTGNLDEKTCAAIMEMILSLCGAGGISLILVTHNEKFAQ
jgi:lipoprotein-releasing system ATP-binding protein